MSIVNSGLGEVIAIKLTKEKDRKDSENHLSELFAKKCSYCLYLGSSIP